MTTKPDFALWMQSRKNQIERILGEFLPDPEAGPEVLSKALRYAVLGHGKRIRPLLVFAAAELGTADEKAVAHAAAAVELIHTYSLVHDDLPAMDNDSLRHGKPALHVKFGDGMATLAGDTLQALAFSVLSATSARPETALRAIGLLAGAAGFNGMCGGQALDLINTKRPITLAELKEMHRKKTGALIEAAVLLGVLSTTSQVDDTLYRDLKHFAADIGLAFQIIDDILDAETSTATLGKTAGKDAAENKATFVTLLGIDKARREAETLGEGSIRILKPYLPRSQNLIQLARFITDRAY